MGTTARNVRVGNYLWALAGLVTKRRHEDRSKIMVARLETYTKKYATDEERAQAAALFPPEADDQ